MKILYKSLNDPSLAEAFGKLGNTPMKPKPAYNISKIQNKLDSELKSLQKLYRDLVKRHAVLDEKGNIVEPQGPGSYKLKEESVEAFKKEQEELFGLFFEIEKIHPLKLVDLEGANLTPYEITALEPFLDPNELAGEAPVERPLKIAPQTTQPPAS